MAPKLVLNGVHDEAPPRDGVIPPCFSLVPVQQPGGRRPRIRVESPEDLLAETDADIQAILDAQADEIQAMAEQQAASDEDDSDAISDFEDAFDKGYELLQEVEEFFDALLTSPHSSLSRRAKARVKVLNESVSAYLTSYQG